MVANVALDSSALFLLKSYNDVSTQIDTVSQAVASQHDVNTASDNPLLYFQAQTKRAQANAYTAMINKLTNNKTSLDTLSAHIKTITDTATKMRDTITGLSANATGNEMAIAATAITNYLKTIQNMIVNSTDDSGFSLQGGKVSIVFDPNKNANYGVATTAQSAFSNVSLTFTGVGLSIGNMVSQAADIWKTLQVSKNAAGNYLDATGKTVATPDLAAHNTVGLIRLYLPAAGGAKTYAADISTVTNRANFLASVSGFIDNTLSQAAANAGAFHNALDAQLQLLQGRQNSLNTMAENLTKTDLTADSAKSTALQTRQQLLTSLMSMSNQRMSTILGLFR